MSHGFLLDDVAGPSAPRDAVVVVQPREARLEGLLPVEGVVCWLFVLFGLEYIVVNFAWLGYLIVHVEYAQIGQHLAVLRVVPL